MMPPPTTSLDSIYVHLSPLGYEGSISTPKDTDERDLYSILSDIALNPSGKFVLFNQIKQNIEGHFNKSSNASVERTNAGKLYHIISTGGRVNLDDADYWGEKVETINDIVTDMKSSEYAAAAASDFVATAFVSRSPYLNPSTRGTEKIDLFLNYMPSIVVSQMVPYLDVEFRITGATVDYLNTPGYLRFLMGSTGVSNLSDSDKALRAADFRVISPASGSKAAMNASVTGMELFLMPQTLTNMDALKPDNKTRLVQAKPFLPFASIESFEVKAVNAGAGKFCHKTADLKLKIHDKSRISEMSEFIRGSSGFNQALVWTTYGWLAPTNRGEDDEYFKFINDNMMMKECWQVVNTQFSFDTVGQVSLNLSLVAAAARNMQEITVATVDNQLREFHKAIQTIAELKSKLIGEDDKFNISLESEQILNAGSTNGNFVNLKESGKAIANLVKSLKKSNLTPKELDELSDTLTKMTGNNAYSYNQINNKIGASVKKSFDSLRNKPDPFLVSEKNKSYFLGGNGAKDSALLEQIKKFNGDTKRRSAAIAEANNGINVNVNDMPSVISFGSLFLNFVVPNIALNHLCDELQVFFYGLNDQCGPVSGYSIAEFPINMTSLVYAYAEMLKNTNLESLHIETFLKLIIESQFADQRAIGYGMNQFFKPMTPGVGEVKPVENKQTYEDGMNQWLSDYGSLKIPMIEMYIETGEEGTLNGKNIVANLKSGSYNDPARSGKKIIKRIHIYDRTCNPYRLTQQILDSNGSYQVGQVSRGKIEGIINQLNSTLSDSQKEAIKAALNAGQSYDSALKAGRVPQEKIDSLNIIETPGGATVTIPKGDRQKLKDFLQRGVPTISIGTNGTLVYSANIASKTDGTMGAINLVNAGKNQAKGKATVSDNGLEEIGGLPMRAVPAQLTMTTAGVPTAQLYQLFFVDFNTGTSLDNIYNCTQLAHSISQGKFTTQWTFAYNNGYGKFSSPPSVNSVVSGQLKQLLKTTKDQSAEKGDKQQV